MFTYVTKRLRASRELIRGDIALADGRLAEAIRRLSSAVSDFRETGGGEPLAKCAFLLGRTYELSGRRQDAIRSYSESFNESRKIGDALHTVRSSNSLGTLYMHVDRAKAAELFNVALESCPDDDQRMRSAILGNLGKVRALDGKPRAAARLQGQSAELAALIGDEEGRIDALGERALNLAQTLEFDAALECAREAVAAAKTAEASTIATARGQYAKVLGMAGKASEAMEEAKYAVQAAEEAPKPVLLSALIIATEVSVAHDTEFAIEYGIRAVTLCDPETAPRLAWSARLQLAKALGAAGEASEGLSVLEPALTHAVQREDGVFASRALAVSAQLRLDLGHPDEARSNMAAAVEWWERITADLPATVAESLGLLEVFSSAYTRLERLELDRHDVTAALRAREAGHARLLVRQLRAGRPINQDYDASDVHVTTVVYSQTFKKGSPNWHAYIVRPGLPIAVRNLAVDPSLEPRTEEALSLLSSAEHGDEDSRATALADILLQDCLPALHEWLISPLEDLLPSNGDPISIIPDGVLHHVPFAALPDQSGQPLIDRTAIALAPSIEAVNLLTSRTTKGGGEALVVGSPAMGEHPLAYHIREAKTIASIYGVDPLVGRSASRSQVLARLSRASVVHVASHAALGSRYRFGTIPGMIQLGAEQGDDGALYASEVDSLAISARVVVLSACVSGLGQVASEGSVGLARAFLAAGATSVVGSLWPVNTWSAAMFMVALHRFLSEGQGPSTAARLAMIETRASYPEPVDWAPFTVIGGA